MKTLQMRRRKNWKMSEISNSHVCFCSTNFECLILCAPECCTIYASPDIVWNIIIVHVRRFHILHSRDALLNSPERKSKIFSSLRFFPVYLENRLVCCLAFTLCKKNVNMSTVPSERWHFSCFILDCTWRVSERMKDAEEEELRWEFMNGMKKKEFQFSNTIALDACMQHEANVEYFSTPHLFFAQSLRITSTHVQCVRYICKNLNFSRIKNYQIISWSVRTTTGNQQFP